MMRRYPEAPLIGVGAVVLRRDEVLLIRRAKPPRQGEWSIPGGLQKLGETVFAAAEREVREETGVSVRALGIVDVVDLIDREAGTARIVHHFTLIDVAAIWIDGEAVAGADAAAIAWCPLDGLHRYRLWSETERVIGVAAARWRAMAGP
jgi:ADP-ribose pyrophosphatase YjhB (NUDIX family)